ncbi:SusD/RagB family nutrient-binding outer membrane lipoprotein [Flavihumibacter petaseus]|uniref:SusD/RagB family protein n=1 Tax=Flavihumibacter petaseus NBRC 106054 TaxID=1220578 RepID=A0A0E9MZ68_9BACT|nr:SusD/RagB family nutrient-binding outer membrane lipoprotein [Flavihumibacter petaseus]GAO42899.1 hypothetical protein FPE01S_02_00040 [Flavihumibacter petaseus NBRC 106054]
MKYTISKWLTAGFLVAGLNGCTKDYLDINDDPNNPTESSVELALPTALGYSAYNLGNAYQILGGLWGQYWTQGPTASQYRSLDQYSVTSSDYDRQWESVYSGPLADFRYIVDEGTRTGQVNYVAIGKIMQAYMFQVMTDLQGDIPFSESLNGAANTKPKFDTQEEIYNGLIVLLDDALGMIDEGAASPGDDDYFFHGDMHLWTKFANTLKLKIYLRQAYVRPSVAEAGIRAMYTAGSEFLDIGEDAYVPFNNEVFNQNPLYATYEALTSDNLIASRTIVTYLQATADPRIGVYYARATAAPNTGNFVGIIQGEGPNLPGAQNANSYSKPGPAVGGPGSTGNTGAAAPVFFISAAESYFLQAEAVARGWGDGDAQSLYENGIFASFYFWGLSEDDYNAFIGEPLVKFPVSGEEAQVQQIITQKWVSLSGTENLEGWTEWRRTGYPSFFTISTTSSIGNFFPVRILYADSEVTRNPNTPSQKTVKDKVWWDVNTSGQN